MFPVSMRPVVPVPYQAAKTTAARVAGAISPAVHNSTLANNSAQTLSHALTTAKRERTVPRFFAPLSGSSGQVRALTILTKMPALKITAYVQNCQAIVGGVAQNAHFLPGHIQIVLPEKGGIAFGCHLDPKGKKVTDLVDTQLKDTGESDPVIIENFTATKGPAKYADDKKIQTPDLSCDIGVLSQEGIAAVEEFAVAAQLNQPDYRLQPGASEESNCIEFAIRLLAYLNNLKHVKPGKGSEAAVALNNGFVVQCQDHALGIINELAANFHNHELMQKNALHTEDAHKLLALAGFKAGND